MDFFGFSSKSFMESHVLTVNAEHVALEIWKQILLSWIL